MKFKVVFDEVGDCQLKWNGTFPRSPSKALKASIAKWRALAKWHQTQEEGSSPFVGGVDDESCALCQRYLDDDCAGCPIYSATNTKYCNGTPYRDYRQSTDVTEAAGAAYRMLGFLKGLRK